MSLRDQFACRLTAVTLGLCSRLQSVASRGIAAAQGREREEW